MTDTPEQPKSPLEVLAELMTEASQNIMQSPGWAQFREDAVKAGTRIDSLSAPLASGFHVAGSEYGA